MEKAGYYTIEEVNELIPSVELRLNQIVFINAQLSSALNKLDETEYQQLEYNNSIDDYTNTSCDIKLLKSGLEKKIDELLDMGCIIDDLEKGILYWPCKYKKDEIWLSWQQGERSISHWVNQDQVSQRHNTSELNER
ncbi:MAG: hypothetical protein CMF46_02435 [Legionellales bacterium]|nr:hypothetical protein [Legionellales bacterium]|tara:strand:+ start:1831 stop:2241 length:411 start_codon:yes stop_codon:yes gene_type:complete